MILKEYKKRVGSKNFSKITGICAMYNKTFLLIRCDICGNEFERSFNVAMMKRRPRHYCGLKCHAVAMKSGGIADESRKSACQKAYGSDYYITQHDVAAESGRQSHRPEVEAQRQIAIKKRYEDNSIQLKRGLRLCRSQQEVDFIKLLEENLQRKLIVQKYINGWWIDAYDEVTNTWIQFDGKYWHSREGRPEKDALQTKWFEENQMRLIRVTDQEWMKDPNETVVNAVKLMISSF
jgi:very-short-patch-repair endonuclease